MWRKRNLMQMNLSLAALLLAVLPTLVGCLAADTRGDEPVDEIIISGTASWDNGIGALMQLKCAICHQLPPGPFSPATLPLDLDLRFQFSPGPGLRGAQEILVFINAGILQGSGAGTRRMPLAYATPLTPREIDALETWSLVGGL